MSFRHRLSAAMVVMSLLVLLQCEVSFAATGKEELRETCFNIDCIVNRSGQFWLTAPFEASEELLDRFISMAPSYLDAVALPKHDGAKFTLCEQGAWTTVYRDSGGPNDFELQVLKEVNSYRAENGLTELTIDPILSMSARLSAQVIVETGEYSHYDKLYGNPWNRVTYFDSTIDNIVENIWAVETVDFGGDIIRVKNDSPYLIVEGWKNSPSHNAAMLKPELVYIGVGHINAAPLAPVVLHMTPEREFGVEPELASTCVTCENE